MATYYVDGANGNDGDDGTDPIPQGGGVGPKATLNGAEDIPVAATDLVWVRQGVYREMLTCDVSGGAGAGNEILYQGDVAGKIWGVGGIVRITGSDDDQTMARGDCIAANSIDYRAFRGFNMGHCDDYTIDTGDCSNWTVEDCAFTEGEKGIDVDGTTANWTIRRCLFANHLYYGIRFQDATEIDNSGHVVENCLMYTMHSGIWVVRVGDIVVRNCVFSGMYGFGINVATAPNNGHPLVVNNSVFISCENAGVSGTGVADITEDFNTFYSNATDRVLTNIGANSETYAPLFHPPLLHSGASQISGFKFPWWFGELSEWSPLRAITGSNEPTEDLRGIARPVTASKNSWGPCQFMDMERETGTVHAGSVSMVLHDAGRHQIWVPVANESTTISVYVYREANYAGNLPQMIVKQPGQADDVTTDAAAASQWNLLTTTLTPAADPPYVIVELVSRNTNGANDKVFFDDLVVS